jgi:N utilization substance protein A
VRGVKVAVWSKEGSVDPAGACIGPNGTRVKHVEDEIGGDKIEVVTWSSEAHLFVCNALQPAEVSRLLIDHEARKMDVIVPDSQLSKAIGKRGKNVRLASMLTGWSLDIYADSKMKEREAQTLELLAAYEGVRREDLERACQQSGLRTIEQLADATPAQLNSVPPASAEAIIAAARHLMSRRDLGEDIYQGSNEANRRSAWASWPRSSEVLTYQLFERCHQIGYGPLSTISSTTPEVLAGKIGVTEPEAYAIIAAARAHIQQR